jgi:two-component system, chemotaxis family, chemotaxis protein CheY
MGKTVMVVDDSAKIRQIVSFVIRNGGYDVVEAEDSEDALTKIDADASLNLIVTGLNIPKPDGVGLIKNVRKHPTYQLIPIIMLATESQESERLLGKEAGATDWIVKPFRPEELMDLIRKALG